MEDIAVQRSSGALVVRRPTGTSRRSSQGREVTRMGPMSTEWQRVPCDGGACPEIKFGDDEVAVRDSNGPGNVVTFSRDGFEALKQAVMDGLI